MDAEDNQIDQKLAKLVQTSVDEKWDEKKYYLEQICFHWHHEYDSCLLPAVPAIFMNIINFMRKYKLIHHE